MKKFDLIKLINATPYTEYNLIQDEHGIVIETHDDFLDVLFFNPQNTGEYTIVNIKSEDISVDKEKLPDEIKSELLSAMDKLISKASNKLTPLEVKAYDRVELLVEDNKYSKFGIHKGDIGIVVSDTAVQNEIEVDFPTIKDENYDGLSISVNIKDLKVIKSDK